MDWLTKHLPGTLGPVYWLLLALVPVAIILLYFLKLRRRPIEVPSTYLWHKTIEDLHVNSIWQRLRKNLLLLLQLLLVGLAMFALLRPSWQGRQTLSKRLVFLIDASASMQATDIKPSRLEEAKRRAIGLIDQMHHGEVAMVVSFADGARVEQGFTDDRQRLRQAVSGIQPTEHSTDLTEALRVAAGLANPGRSAAGIRDDKVADPLPADVYILSDGRFPAVTGFSLGNLKPHFVPIGETNSRNVGITAFSVGRNESRRRGWQAFASLENFGPAPAKVSMELLLDGQEIDFRQAEIPAGEQHPEPFPLGSVDSGVLRLRITSGDDFALDDEAVVPLRLPRRVQVLVFSPGCEELEWALATKAAAELAVCQRHAPDVLKTPDYAKLVGAGVDLVIFDRCAPQQMPPCNTLFLGRLPPAGTGWSADEAVRGPRIIDLEAAHPLLQWLDLGDVLVSQATPLKPPEGGQTLIDSHRGPLLSIAPRGPYEDAVLGFALVDEVTRPDGTKVNAHMSNWDSRLSFPTFVVNVLDYLGGARRAASGESRPPGKPIVVEAVGAKSVRVRTPAGTTHEVSVDAGGRAAFADTHRQGIYEVQSDAGTQLYAVNLFDREESKIRVDENPMVHIGYVDVEGVSDWQPARRELWKWLLLLVLAVLGFEWWVYQRRVS